MVVGDVTILIAFIGGLLSFLSPCVFPIIPGFLAYLTGTSTTKTPKRSQVLLQSALFVAGFSLVFALMGVLLSTLLSYSASDVQLWLSRIGGAIVIIFGLFLMRLIRIPFLERAHTFNVVGKVQSRHLTSVLFGAAFAAGWTPCVSVALGAILGLAANSPGIAFWLLMAYALGLGLPFLIIGFFTVDAAKFINRYALLLRYMNIFFGALLVVLGILLFTQELNQFANFKLLNTFLMQ
tara:strand:+ start:21308 stop:22018 length:711 start_codon:yes stop_codon:yes gene_type:complete